MWRWLKIAFKYANQIAKLVKGLLDIMEPVLPKLIDMPEIPPQIRNRLALAMPYIKQLRDILEALGYK